MIGIRPDPNWCPDCGEPANLCRCDEEINLEDYDDAEICDCGRRADDRCGFCGRPLCFMCFECGAGFCNSEHTQEQIDDYAKQIGGEQKMSKWQLIETAPRDGSLVLIYEDGEILLARYRAEIYIVGQSRYKSWVVDYTFNDEQGGEMIVDNPTHWCPIPNFDGELKENEK